MGQENPFVLLDDARAQGASAAQLFCNPREIFIARRMEDVAECLERADAARIASGASLAGYIAYEAALALEDRLIGRGETRQGGGGPLVWLGLFDDITELASEQVDTWLCDNGGEGAATIGPLEPGVSFGQYNAMFADICAAIEAGDIYQANLTIPLVGGYHGHPAALYREMRTSAKAPYGGLIWDSAHWLLSFSPELFFSLRGDAIKAKPMKGTRPRSADEAADLRMANALMQSEKDRAENLMIVDLIRNDLSRIAAPGSVVVENPFAVESYPSVHQMVSTVKARLDNAHGAADIIRALFPCGSITGAPKIRAMELIDDIEPSVRGPYCGAIGRINANGDAAFNVAIRTLRLTPIENERGKAVLGVGSAIVADSDPQEEWRECHVKSGFVRQSSHAAKHAQFDLIETMRFDPQLGISHLELHLERMKHSAAELGFSFDRHAARNRIQALCFDLETDAAVRLIVARSGAMTLSSRPLPAALPEPLLCAALAHPLDPEDWRLRHKTSDRGFYESSRAAAGECGAHDAILVRGDGLVTESSFANIFVARDGLLLTPPAHLGLLPGVFRRSLLEEDKAAEAELTLADLKGGFFIGNALRGLIPAQLIAKK